METEAEDHFVEELIQKMDTNVDGKIDYQEFVHFVRNCGTADILSAQTSRSNENISLEWKPEQEYVLYQKIHWNDKISTFYCFYQ